MSKIVFVFISLSLFSIIFSSCSIRDDEAQIEEKILPLVAPPLKYGTYTHKSVSEIAAYQLGLSPERIATIKDACTFPDIYQSGIDNGYNQQWSHAYLLAIFGVWLWGDADDDYKDNITGSGSDGSGGEGYGSLSAKYHYLKNDQKNGDAYLGYALHYIEDVNFVLHSSAPSISMLADHFKFEEWMDNNLTAGHDLLSAVENDNSYYQVTDLKKAIKNSASGCSYLNSTLGKKAWDAYTACGCPTTAGSGTSELVGYVKQMMIRAGRYSKGTIIYVLDTYGQWQNNY